MARIRTPRLGDQLNTLGEFIAAQRRSAELSMRQLAEQAGVSNPYLSQIERGLRRPSAEVLQQLSKALRISAETLYVRAGILDPEEHPSTSVELAVLADASITERQKRVLIDVYASFVRENESARDEGAEPGSTSAPDAATTQSRTGSTTSNTSRSSSPTAKAATAPAGSATRRPTTAKKSAAGPTTRSTRTTTPSATRSTTRSATRSTKEK